MRLFLLILFLLFWSINLLSQPFVISEYFNDKTPDKEWTEILVIQDMSSIAGCTLRDNSSTGDWRQGIIFKDIPLWKNLRSGTIIVINHRDGDIDDDKSDGYIEVGATSSKYFDNPISSSNSQSLNISATHDIVQLLTKNNYLNIHSLGNVPQSKSKIVFNAIIGLKIATPSEAKNSVHVYPGANISDYFKGLDSNYAITTDSSSKGLPNGNNEIPMSTNHLFWRSLREPKWITPPNLQSQITPDFKGIKLSWNAASTIKDNNEGYLIVRYTDNGNQPIILNDGEIYGPGRKIGPYLIIDTLPDLTNNSYTDNFKIGTFNCGEKYSYRVYIYRYQRSNVNPEIYDKSPLNGRGRAYNETDYASTNRPIEKSIPIKPVLSTVEGNKVIYCTNEFAHIITDINESKRYNFNWYLDDNKISSKDTSIIVNKSGNYKLVIIDKASGCADSNEIFLTFVESPEIQIQNLSNSKIIANDTIIEVCGNSSINLQGIVVKPKNYDAYWSKDGNKISVSSNLIINSSGIYRYVAQSNSLCIDSSIAIDARFTTPNFTLSTNKLFFDDDLNIEQQFTIKNNGVEELVIGANNITINPSTNFVIVNPIINNQAPLLIQPNSEVIVTIKFQSSDFDKKNAILKLSLCNISKLIDLEGMKKNSSKSKLLSDPSIGVNFGNIVINCNEMFHKNTNLFISGQKSLKTILKKMKQNYFEVNSGILIEEQEVDLSPNIIYNISISINPSLPIGIYRDSIIILYRNLNDNNYDTLIIPVSAEIIDPKFNPDIIKLDFSNLPTCITKVDTSILLDINPFYEFQIDSNIINSSVILTDKLPIKFNAKDKNYINLEINFTNQDLIQTYIKLSPCGINIPLEILPPQEDIRLVYKDTIDFGIINNAEYCGDYLDSLIFETNLLITIDNIEYMSPVFLFDILNSQKLNKGINTIYSIFSYQDTGIYNDSLIINLKECNKRIVIFIKGERIDRPIINLADSIINFGNGFLNNNQYIKTKLYNQSKDKTLLIKSISLQDPFYLVKPSLFEFPMSVRPLDSIEMELQFLRDQIGSRSDSMSIEITSPCNNIAKYELRGNTLDINENLIKFVMPANYQASLHNNFTLPISIDLPKNFDQDKAAIEVLTLYFHYDRAIFDINRINQISNSLILNHSEFTPGKILLNYKLDVSTKLQDEQIMELEVKPLLGYSLTSKIILDSVVYTAKSLIETPSDSTIINISGDCLIEYRAVEIDKKFGLILKSQNPISSTIDLDLGLLSEDNTELSLFDIHGNLVKRLINEPLKSGNYNVKYNVGNLFNGAYFIVLKNGINSKVLKIMIIK